MTSIYGQKPEMGPGPTLTHGDWDSQTSLCHCSCLKGNPPQDENIKSRAGRVRDDSLEWGLPARRVGLGS